MAHVITRRSAAVAAAVERLGRYAFASKAAQKEGQPGVISFAYGNPNEMPIAGFADALQRWTTPQRPDWFAYPDEMHSAKGVVAASLRERNGMPFEAQDIFMTNGAFGGLAVLISALTDVGDEVIFISPPWFFYEAMIVSVGAVPVRVKVNPTTFDLDVEAIAAAITPRTRAIIINSPNNPTGKIYPPETLEALSAALTDASSRFGQPIYLISDEAYSRIVYEGNTFHSPVAYYPYSFLVYTYGKTLLAPGERIGYIALPPTMPEREALRQVLYLTQYTMGYAFPNRIPQYALAELDKLSIDLEHLTRKRDQMVNALWAMGYELHSPESTFYLLPRSPIEDDELFVDMLAEADVLCLPGAVVEMPGYFRISLTASDDMIEKALPIFARVREQALD